MNSEINQEINNIYKKINRKIEESGLKGDELLIARNAIDQYFNKEAVSAKGMAAAIALIGNEESYNGIRKIIGNALERARENKPTLTQRDKDLLGRYLSYLKENGRIISAIENGSYLFLLLLNSELEKKDIHEIAKLQKLIENSPNLKQVNS